VKLRRLLGAEHVARIEETTNIYIYIYIILMAEIACKIFTWMSQKWFGG
jgi:hypothetical protein